MLKFLAFVMVPTQFRRFVFGSAEWENCPLIPRFGSNRSDRIFLESHRIFLAREADGRTDATGQKCLRETTRAQMLSLAGGSSASTTPAHRKDVPVEHLRIRPY
mmetsp:Transcript_6496/g.19155  ORF Transcript_6496/g.19155 Transcript_6496/m.19155 type:complete len:104 (-) Transcript_6496:2101-2412(-)